MGSEKEGAVNRDSLGIRMVSPRINEKQTAKSSKKVWLKFPSKIYQCKVSKWMKICYSPEKFRISLRIRCNS